MLDLDAIEREAALCGCRRCRSSIAVCAALRTVLETTPEELRAAGCGTRLIFRRVLDHLRRKAGVA